MYAYRLSVLHNLDLASIDYSVMRDRLRSVPLHKIMGYSHLMLDKDRDHFMKLIKLLNWNGTMAGTIRCFAGISPHSFTVGFLLCSGTSPEVFVGAPQPLPHLNDDAIDRTDSDEKARTIAGMTGQEWIEGKPVAHNGWRISAKGNWWTTIDGTNCVVVLGPSAGTFIGLLRGGGNNRITTREFTAPANVMDYIEKNYRSLVKQWMTSDDDNEPDPFYLGD